MNLYNDLVKNQDAKQGICPCLEYTPPGTKGKVFALLLVTSRTLLSLFGFGISVFRNPYNAKSPLEVESQRIN